MKNRRVVVTGLGMVTPLGNTVASTWDALLKGKSGVSTIDRFDVSELSTKIAALVRDFDPQLSMSLKDSRRTELFVQFATEAGRQAMEDAGFGEGEVDDALSARFGVAVGAGIGGLTWIENNYAGLVKGGPRKISPFFIPGAIINMSAGFISMKHKLRGPNISIVTACTTGTHNIGYAARTIASGDADAMVAGGTEMATDLLGLGGFAAMKAVSSRNDEPEKASRPWDRDRDGFVLGEGAGVLILEELECAKKRGAHIYAELVGFGMSSDAYHMTSPDPDGTGFIACMENAITDSGMDPSSIDYVNAHGTSTPVGDVIEAKAIAKVFRNHSKIAVSSTKSMTGHLLGAAGSVEAIFSILAIRDQIVPPTINLDNPDIGCDLDFIPHKAREMSVNATLSNSFGFGGTNGSLLFRKFK